MQLRAWDNKGGTITTWAAAVAAGVDQGMSAPFTSPELWHDRPGPPPNLVGLTSFNIHTIPEPSTLALIGFGRTVLFMLYCLGHDFVPRAREHPTQNQDSL